jgi:hypothetical protein
VFLFQIIADKKYVDVKKDLEKNWPNLWNDFEIFV